MSRPRFFATNALLDALDAIEVPLSEADVHHAARVLRLKAGEEIVVVEPGGHARVVEITSAGPGTVTGRIVGVLPDVPQPHVTLVQGIAKGPAMDAIVRHAVELGVERIVPLACERSVIRLKAERAGARSERWQRIALAAAEQSQRTRVAVVEEPTSVDGATAVASSADAAILLWEEAKGASLAAVLTRLGVTPQRPELRVSLFIGPEGGFGSEEVRVLEAAGATVASLGPAILRAETAALAAVTLTAQALGALGEAADAV